MPLSIKKMHTQRREHPATGIIGPAATETDKDLLGTFIQSSPNEFANAVGIQPPGVTRLNRQKVETAGGCNLDDHQPP